MNRFFAYAAILILALSTYIGLSGHRLGMAINRWQASFLGDGSYFPALTIFAVAIPALLILALVKYAIAERKQKH